MIQIHNSQELRDLDAKLVMTIHDEVMLECPALYADQASEILPRIMIDAAAPYIDVPMKCDPAVESRWYTGEYAVAVQSEFKKLTDKGLDREAAFIAVGGVRGSMPWEEFAKMKLPVPSIEEQRKIVQAYKTVTDRIALKKQINDNLAA